MLNKWVGMGRLVHSPELRNTQSGKNVASFSIACERDYKVRAGIAVRTTSMWWPGETPRSS